MNKAELAASVAEQSGLSRKDSEKAVEAMLEVIGQELGRGNKIQIMGFGSFEVRERPERIGRNPGTLEEITIPASKSPVFKPGKLLKDTVNS